ncbi:general transcription factor II-I repeat domain-containing protein 2B-like [Clavelina lepadiformis]|uniref:general transcription factor II-I repeat domain-containing protein 2B-like n=1 Tax=Clavelina lepadiformis TaxID=159417 RepID=UPI004041B16A
MVESWKYITHHLSKLNLKLQGKKEIITQMYDHVKSFKVKLRLWMKQLGKVEAECMKEYTDLLSNLLQQFEVRFAELEVLEPQFRLFSTPFAVEIDSVAEELQMELVELQFNKTVLRSRITDENLQATLKLVSADNLKPNIEVLVHEKRCQLSSQNKK